MKIRNFTAVIAATIALAGCSTLPPQTAESSASVSNDAGGYPENYKSIAIEYIKTDFFDPYSIRSAQISKPRIGPSWVLGSQSGWIVCVRANAKNRMGAYIGLTDTVLLIRNGAIQSSTTGEVPYYCDSADYQPFPEVGEIT